MKILFASRGMRDVFGPLDPSWANDTARWNTATEPQVKVVVRPAQESDVSIIVKYCDRNKVDFVAVNRRHGAAESIATFKAGGKSALIQGGQYIAGVMRGLYEAGYVTSTGSNPCVGFLGPALGGGHGRYQGLHGLASDNFINLNVVLADGSNVQVNKNSHSDLFWAMQGAGHNYGIVTSAESRIYPRKIDTWHYHNYVWSQDKLEVLFERLNAFHKDGKTPPEMGVEFGSVAVDSSFNTTDPVLSWTFGYAGPAKDAERLLKPFNDIPALSQVQGDVPYPELPAKQGQPEGGPGCASSLKVGSSASLRSWNITSERRVLTLFGETMHAYPALAAGAVVFYEGYATKTVQAVDHASTAYPHRDDLHLAFSTFYIPSPELQAPAQKLADQIREIWFTSQPGHKPSVYANYATGVEPLGAMYGYEPWRMQRLLGLKAKYDPHNRFRFYNPLIKG
ncbi:CAZyme family AA7 [Apiospora sp. TS-2023a]